MSTIACQVLKDLWKVVLLIVDGETWGQRHPVDVTRVWVPETVLAVVDLPLRRPTEPGMIRRWR